MADGTAHYAEKVGDTQQNIISKCSQLAPKEYKIRHDWGEMMIHWELCKKLKFDHTKVASYSSPKKVTTESLRTREA